MYNPAVYFCFLTLLCILSIGGSADRRIGGSAEWLPVALPLAYFFIINSNSQNKRNNHLATGKF